jgi:hypothetical protein
MPLPIIGAAIGIAGGIGKMIGRGKANRSMKQLMKEDPIYKENPLAKQRLALAQALFNARTPGALQAERNIFSNQANTIANINRNATDSSQALALATGAQGQTNQDLMQLGMSEMGDQQRRLGNLTGAQEGLINEQDKVFQDQVRRFGNKAQIKGAINENRQNTWGDISNLGFGIMNFGMAGGFDGMMGGGQTSMPLHGSQYNGVWGSPIQTLQPR